VKPRSEDAEGYLTYLEIGSVHKVDEPTREEGQPTSGAFLYIPDLSSQSRWASHLVPTTKTTPAVSRPVGFRRP
jgi:cell division inhibitor SulA